MNWVANNLDLIWELTLVHLRQSVVAIILGFALSLPLGWLAWRYRVARGGILTVTGLLYTIPSLALLMIIPVIVGLPPFNEVNLILALTIYAIALMVRSVTDGLDSVDASVRLSATAMGYGAGRRFWAVDLPLAGPVILAGLRVTAVSTIALATVGALIGVTNLGYLFTNGSQRRIIPEVLAGIVAVVVIALVLDGLLIAAGRVLMPWSRAQRRRVRRGALPLEVSVA
ncbi:osmoprotectant transport system permease protein [Microbacterium sp. cf046]|uniref:ABC transporter permease n=1 Tax=Microbacterium sp. cf046 TaxID=1761803 RepID=UPI0008E1D687|nr:ABC transporter permease [Microbacterium sp. cf046]SFS09023.1 osmoprotectant transport system permease protein [Microbacterium sp. cf046]